MEYMNNFDWELFLQILTVTATIVGTVYKLLSSRAAKRKDTRGAKPKKAKRRRSDAGRRGTIKHAAFSREKAEAASAPKTFREKVLHTYPDAEYNDATGTVGSGASATMGMRATGDALDIGSVNYTQAHKTPVPLVPQVLLDAHLTQSTQTEILKEAAYQRAAQAGMGRAAALMQEQSFLLGQQNQAQMNRLAGITEPLSGIPRDRPYWESMYGNLGMGGQHFRGGK